MPRRSQTRPPNKDILKYMDDPGACPQAYQPPEKAFSEAPCCPPAWPRPAPQSPCCLRLAQHRSSGCFSSGLFQSLLQF